MFFDTTVSIRRYLLIDEVAEEIADLRALASASEHPAHAGIEMDWTHVYSLAWGLTGQSTHAPSSVGIPALELESTSVLLAVERHQDSGGQLRCAAALDEREEPMEIDGAFPRQSSSQFGLETGGDKLLEPPGDYLIVVDRPCRFVRLLC